MYEAARIALQQHNRQMLNFQINESQPGIEFYLDDYTQDTNHNNENENEYENEIEIGNEYAREPYISIDLRRRTRRLGSNPSNHEQENSNSSYPHGNNSLTNENNFSGYFQSAYNSTNEDNLIRSSRPDSNRHSLRFSRMNSSRGSNNSRSESNDNGSQGQNPNPIRRSNSVALFNPDGIPYNEYEHANPRSSYNLVSMESLNRNRNRSGGMETSYNSENTNNSTTGFFITDNNNNYSQITSLTVNPEESPSSYYTSYPSHSRSSNSNRRQRTLSFLRNEIFFSPESSQESNNEEPLRSGYIDLSEIPDYDLNLLIR